MSISYINNFKQYKNKINNSIMISKSVDRTELKEENAMIESLLYVANPQKRYDDFFTALFNGGSINFDYSYKCFNNSNLNLNNAMSSAIIYDDHSRGIGGALSSAITLKTNYKLIKDLFKYNPSIEMLPSWETILTYSDKTLFDNQNEEELNKKYLEDLLINIAQLGAEINKPIKMFDKEYANLVEYAKQNDFELNTINKLDELSKKSVMERKKEYRTLNAESINKYVDTHYNLQYDGKDEKEQNEVFINACRGGFTEVVKEGLKRDFKIDPELAYKEALCANNSDVVEILMENKVDYNFNLETKNNLQHGTSLTKYRKQQHEANNKKNNSIDGINYSMRLSEEHTNNSFDSKSKWKFNIVDGAIRQDNIDVLKMALLKGAEIEYIQNDVLQINKFKTMDHKIKVSALDIAKQYGSKESVDLISEYENDKKAFNEKYTSHSHANSLSL